MKTYYILLITFFVFSIQSAETRKCYTQTYPDGSYVNWTTGEIGATGAGISKTSEWTPESKADAYRAAQLDAMRKLVEVINKIHVDSDTTVRQFQESDNVIKKKIEGVVRNFTEKDVRFTNNKLCNVDVIVPVNGDGSIADIFLGESTAPVLNSFTGTPVVTPSKIIKEPEAAGQKEEITEEIAETPAEIPDAIETKPENQTSSMLAQNDSAPVTGLIVNASGIPVTPALNPRIISDSGEEVYGFKKANRDFRRLNGLASYAPDMNDACLDKRVTEKPFVINAKGVKETKPCIIIISNDDAQKFENLKNSGRVLEHCRVIIVTKNETGK